MNPAPSLSTAPAPASSNSAYWLVVLVALLGGGCAPTGSPWLSPSAEAAPLLRAAITAWEEAGVPVGWVYVGPGGAPVMVTDGPPRPGSWGVTSVAWDGRIEWVRVDRAAPTRTWTHEVGHVLGATGHGGCVMRTPSYCDDLTAEDLELAGW